MEKQTLRIKKPKGYKSSFIVYDEDPILIVCLDYTHFQLQQKLDYNWDDIEVVDDSGEDIVIAYSE